MMKKTKGILFWMVLFLSGLALGPAWGTEKKTEIPAPPGRDSGYVLGAGDVLTISVWKDEALTRTVIVLPDGTLSFPLIGRVQAEGKTVDQLETEIETRIVRYVTKPVLSVEVKQVNSMLIYIIGRVKRPGSFALNAEITVLQALAMAGGLDPFAKSGSIRIIRKNGDQNQIIPFDYDDAVRGKDLKQNIPLRRGDTIVVP